MPKIVTPVEHLPKLIARKKVAAYVRVSSGKEAMIHSLAAQADYYSTLISKENEWVFVGIYSDEAITGTKGDRKGFQQMLDDCKDGKIDIIVTKSISRFARNTVTLLETVRSLKLMGVDVFFEEQNIHTMSADGELMLTILASYAQEESRSVSENMKWRIKSVTVLRAKREIDLVTTISIFPSLQSSSICWKPLRSPLVPVIASSE